MKEQDNIDKISPETNQDTPQLVINNTDGLTDNQAGELTDSQVDAVSEEGDVGDMSLKDIIRGAATEEELPNANQFTLRKILGGDILNSRQVKSQVWLILLITLFLVIYVGNRYSCQKAQIQIAKLEQQLQDIQKKALSMSSELTELSRETNVLKILKANNDTTLKALEQPPYCVKVEE